MRLRHWVNDLLNLRSGRTKISHNLVTERDRSLIIHLRVELLRYSKVI